MSHNGRNYLITAAAGNIGSELVNLLLEDGARVLASHRTAVVPRTLEDLGTSGPTPPASAISPGPGAIVVQVVDAVVDASVAAVGDASLSLGMTERFEPVARGTGSGLPSAEGLPKDATARPGA